MAFSQILSSLGRKQILFKNSPFMRLEQKIAATLQNDQKSPLGHNNLGRLKIKRHTIILAPFFTGLKCLQINKVSFSVSEIAPVHRVFRHQFVKSLKFKNLSF